MNLRRALGALAVACGALWCAPTAAGETPPHGEDLKSMELGPLADGEAVRLIWHAWHRRPGTLTLVCLSDACRAEIRYTDGYGTYQQGELAVAESRPVQVETAQLIFSAVDARGLRSLEPDLPVDGLYGSRQATKPDEAMICIHAPYYFVERRSGDSYFLLYRYCQDNYADGLRAVAPMIALFETLFPEHMSQVSAYSDLEARGERLREIE